jgi:hypothetical protein
MAITENKYTGNGSTVLYSFTFPYLEVADIKVSLDGTLTTAYTLANATTVQFNTAPANGVAIRLFRQTNDDALNAQFFPGSAIRSTDLNNNFTQNLYVTQESNRDATQGITTADAATATANTALSNSSAAVSTANTASSNASAAVSTANTASSNASAAVSTANTASSNATTAVSTANAATATANSAASDAATAISTANSAVSTANTASTNATNAVNTANSASSAASSAVSTANTASSNASAAVSTANTASSNATSAVNTANSALSTANAAASAVANAILYDIVANVAAIPASPANNDAVEVIDSTGIESFTPLTSIPGGFAGNSGLSVRIVYTTTGNTWTWIQYFPNDPETRYLKEAVTTSDTAPVSPSDGDLWYDSVGGRTYVYYDDGAGSQWVDTSPQGSGVSDAISEGNTSAEVIDTGSDGRFVVTTEGTERLRVDPSGRLGIGTTSPTYLCNVIAAAGSQNIFQAGQTGVSNGYSITSNGTNLTHAWFNGGSEAARIDSSGRLGIGTSSPQGLIDARADAVAATRVICNNATIADGASTNFDYYLNTTRLGGLVHGFNSGSTYFGIDTWNGSAATRRLTITAGGNVGIGTTAPGQKLDVNGEIVCSPNTAGKNTFQFTTQAADDASLIMRSNTTVKVNIQANGTSYFNGGNVGIGTTSPASLLTSYAGNVSTLGAKASTGLLIENNGSVGNVSQIGLGYTFSSTNHPIAIAAVTTSGAGSTRADLVFATRDLTTDVAPTERARIDSSGRLLVGTSTARSNFYNTTADAGFLLEGTGAQRRAAVIGDDFGSALILGLQKSGAPGGNTIVASGDGVGEISFQGNDGSEFVACAQIKAEIDNTPGANDMPGRLVFSTTADGASSPTERMRITSAGTMWGFSTNEAVLVLGDSRAAGTEASIVLRCLAAAVNTGNDVFRVLTNGNVLNSNNSYGALSDLKLKENIVDASSQWDDLKALQVRNYNFKEGQTHTQIGLVAQEAELVSPGLVTESPDRDENGNDLGTVTKSVNYSVLYMKAVKALQEAMTRIETLEAANTDLAARLTALEGGTN